MLRLTPACSRGIGDMIFSRRYQKGNSVVSQKTDTQPEYRVHLPSTLEITAKWIDRHLASHNKGSARAR
jgi:hypothetical protein